MAYRDLDEEDPAEVEASKFDLAYISLDGNIGCLVNGAGLAMATMDTIKLYGAEPANFLDVGGGATTEKVTEAFKIMLKNPNVKAILVNIFGGIMKCDTIAEGVVAASKAVGLTVPLVVRMKGTNEEAGKKILADSGLPIITANTMAEAAEKVVAAVGKPDHTSGEMPVAAATGVIAGVAGAAPAFAQASSSVPHAAAPVAVAAHHDTHHAAEKADEPAPQGSWAGKLLWLAGMGLVAALLLRMCGHIPPVTPVAAPKVASAPAAQSQQGLQLNEWQARMTDGKLVLQGRVADQATKDRLLADAAQAVGAANVVDRLTVDSQLPKANLGANWDKMFAWLKDHPTVGIQADGSVLALGGTIGEALVPELAGKLHTWFGDSIDFDASALRPQAMKAAEALKAGATQFTIQVEFETAKAKLSNGSKSELDDLAKALKETGAKGEVAGHTDNVGNAEANLKLSQERAEAVKAYLVQHGVPANQLTAKGYGETMPIADNATPEGQQRNRRVEFSAQ